MKLDDKFKELPLYAIFFWNIIAYCVTNMISQCVYARIPAYQLFLFLYAMNENHVIGIRHIPSNTPQ